MESRSKRILELVTQNVSSNVQLGQEPEEAPNIFNKENSQNANVPRRDSTSSSSSSSSSGPSYYEDSDDSVKDPDYQIIQPKLIRRAWNLHDEENAPADKTDQNVTETEVRLATDPVINTDNGTVGNMDVETEIGLGQQNERTENDDQLMNAIDSILSNRLTPTQEIENVAASTSGVLVTNTNEDPTPTKKGKKRPINVDNWRKNVAKKLRNCGKSYQSNITKQVVPERKLGELCKEACAFKCRENFSNDQRRKIFGDYWNLQNIEKQWSFIASSVEEVGRKDRYIKLDSEGKVVEPKRTNNNAFYLCSEKGEKIRVCKLFFKNTLGINNRPITTAISKKNKETNISSMKDNRGCHGHQPKTDESLIKGVKEFINSIPKIESHYIRANSQRLYIDGSKNIADLHHDYVEGCKEKDVDYVNYVMFYRIFNKDFNISFFTPKKDMCDVCEAFKNLPQEEKETKREEYENHQKEKGLSRLEKEKDKNNKDLTVCVYDLQAVFQCPKGEISVFYYKSKLNILNLTIYNIQNNAAECFVWDEAHANRGVNEIGTCVFKYIEKIASIGNDVNIVFYSDNCAGQQKNKFMIAMYLFAVQKFTNIKSITHKFLIRGHTQNEGDSAHSQIERQIKKDLKKGPLYTPDAFINAIKNARKKSQPFRVNEMCYEDFYDWKNVCSQMSFQIQKDDGNDVVKTSDLKVIKIKQDDIRAIHFKNSYADEDFKRAVVIKKRKEINVEVKKAYTAKPGISQKKKAGLMELVNKNLIPRYYRSFYESL